MFRLESIYIYKTNVTLDAKVFLLQVKGGKKNIISNSLFYLPELYLAFKERI